MTFSVIQEILRHSSGRRRTFQAVRFPLLMRKLQEGYHWNVYQSPLLPGYVVKELRDTGYFDRKRFPPSYRLKAVTVGYAEPIIDLSPAREDFKIVLQKYYKDMNLGDVARNLCNSNDRPAIEMLVDRFLQQSRVLWSHKLMDFDAKFPNFVYGDGIPVPISIDKDLVGSTRSVFRTDFFRFVKYFFASNLVTLGDYSRVFLDRIEEMPHLRSLAALPWGADVCETFVNLPVDLWQRDLPSHLAEKLGSIFEDIESDWADGIC